MKNKIILIFLIGVSFFTQAENEAALVFHMGVGANGLYQIGGVIENNSESEVSNSAITYIIMDEHCTPSDAKVANLGEVKSHGKLDFRIPVEGKLFSYRILSITAWDEIGIPKEVIDKTAEVIKEREEDYKKKCNNIR